MSIDTVLLNPATVIKVVGVSQYPAVAATYSGQKVRISHEPDNPYDANAFRVDLITGEQLGYIPAALAARIAEGSTHTAFVGLITDTRSHDGCVVGLDITITAPVPGH